jgi:hypothetical protein
MPYVTPSAVQKLCDMTHKARTLQTPQANRVAELQKAGSGAGWWLLVMMCHCYVHMHCLILYSVRIDEEGVNSRLGSVSLRM